MAMSSLSIRGEMAEQGCILALLVSGAEVSRPVVACSYDIVIRENGIWSRIQIKSARICNGRPDAVIRRRTRKSSHRYTADEVDEIMVCVPELGAIWRFSVGESFNRSSVPWVNGSFVSGSNAKRRRATWRKDRPEFEKIECRPEWMKKSTWDVVCMYKEGKSTAEISAATRKRMDSVRSLLRRMSKKV